MKMKVIKNGFLDMKVKEVTEDDNVCMIQDDEWKFQV